MIQKIAGIISRRARFFLATHTLRFSLHALHTTFPHARQWCRLRSTVNRAEHTPQLFACACEFGIHSGAGGHTPFRPFPSSEFATRSSSHPSRSASLEASQMNDLLDPRTMIHSGVAGSDERSARTTSIFLSLIHI